MDINREIEALKQDFDKYDHDFLVSKWVVERLPYIFKDNYEEYLQIKIELAKLLNVDSCSIIFVGSSCTGFSLSPYKSFKEFDDSSDIDIAVISHYYFDVAWHTIRNIKPYGMSPDVNVALREHRERLVYWGTIATDKILGLLPFGEQWLKAIEKMKQHKIFENLLKNFRLYRDTESLRAYHLSNFKRNLPELLGVKSESIEVK